LKDDELRAQILLGRGGLLAMEEKYDEARTYLDRAMALAERAQLPEVRVAALETRAMSDYYQGDAEVAAAAYQRAYEARVELSGDTHPKAEESLNGLAAVAFQRHQYQRAETAWLKVMEIQRRVLGAHHPDLAKVMNNLGRLWLEQRRYAEAEQLLAQAVTNLEAQQGKTDDTMVFVYSNLALARLGLNRNADAAAILDKALLAAAANEHPLQGPIRVYMADAQCRRGRFRQGLDTLDTAQNSIADHYVREPWRGALLQSVRAACLVGVNRPAEAARVLDASLPVLLARWPASSAFGSDGIARAIQVYGAANQSDKVAKYQAASRSKQQGNEFQ
jgi:tetratricopeptide (TPR) repeat protein